MQGCRKLAAKRTCGLPAAVARLATLQEYQLLLVLVLFLLAGQASPSNPYMRFAIRAECMESEVP